MISYWQNKKRERRMGEILLFAFVGIFLGANLLLPISAQAFLQPVIDKLNAFYNTSQLVQFIVSVGLKVKDLAIQVAEFVDTKLRFARKIAFNILKTQILNMITNDIVRFINGQGKPRFVTDWKKFLKTAGDNAAGRFIEELGGGFLCEQFSVQIRVLLAQPKKFPERARCSVSDIVKNVDGFFKNFRNGGWRAWIQVSTVPQNNIYGAYLLAVDENITRQFEAKEAAEAEAGASGGFLGVKVCLEWVDEVGTVHEGETPVANLPPGAICDKERIDTPGKFVGDLGTKVLGLGPDALVSAKEFEEFAEAIVTALINRTIREGFAAIGVKTPPISAAGPERFEPGEGVTRFTTVVQEIAQAPTLRSFQQDLKNTLQHDLLPVEKQTFDALLSLRNDEQKIMDAIARIYASPRFGDGSCKLPSYANVALGNPATVVVEGIGTATIAGNTLTNSQTEAEIRLRDLNQASTRNQLQVDSLIEAALFALDRYIQAGKAYQAAFGKPDELKAQTAALDARKAAFTASRDAIFSDITNSNQFFGELGQITVFSQTQETVQTVTDQASKLRADLGINGEPDSGAIPKKQDEVKKKLAEAQTMDAICNPTSPTVPTVRP